MTNYSCLIVVKNIYFNDDQNNSTLLKQEIQSIHDFLRKFFDYRYRCKDMS